MNVLVTVLFVLIQQSIGILNVHVSIYKSYLTNIKAKVGVVDVNAKVNIVWVELMLISLFKFASLLKHDTLLG